MTRFLIAFAFQSFWFAHMTSQPNECVWTDGSHYIDLSPLMGTTITAPLKGGNQGDVMYYTPCKNSLWCEKSQYMATIQDDIDECSHYLASFNDRVFYSYWNNTQWNFQYSNGEKCSDGADAVLMLQFECNMTAGNYAAVNARVSPPCNYELTMHSALACPVQSTQSVMDVPTCPDGNACFWTDTWYNGNRAVKDNTDAGWHPIGLNSAWSMKNRFANRKAMARGSIYQLCIDPGWNAAQTGFAAYEYNIGQQGSRC